MTEKIQRRYRGKQNVSLKDVKGEYAYLFNLLVDMLELNTREETFERIVRDFACSYMGEKSVEETFGYYWRARADAFKAGEIDPSEP